MILPTQELLKKCNHPTEIKPLLCQAAEAIKNWRVIWSNFLSANIIEEVTTLLEPLNDVSCFSEGGYPGAERKRICFHRTSDFNNINNEQPPISGLILEGNFLFDNTKVSDFQQALEILGISNKYIGDIWLIGDRGAQVICTDKAAQGLDKKKGAIRDVEFICKLEAIENLQVPYKRARKTIRTVEASTRLDALASAGFGLSRSKVASLIKEGAMRLNWAGVNQSSKSLKIGDKVQLANKGSIEVLKIELTKKERWRVELRRN